jgi:hypothetical protein
MLEEMQKIDTSVIDELMEVKRERETISGRLSKMTTEQAQVSDVVFRRVKRDYETRLSGLERKAAPLKDRGRGEYGKLKALLDRLESQHQSTKYDKEELEFRHRLGEFEDKAFEEKLSELERKLDEQKGHLAEANDLRGRFVDAFDSEQELTAPPPTAPAAAAPAPPAAPAAPAPPAAAPAMVAVDDGAGITAPQPVPPPTRVGSSGVAPFPPPPAPVAPPPAAAGIDGTVILAAEPPPAAQKTTEMAIAKLVAIDDDLGAREFALQPQTFVGRTPDNHVRINKPTVSRRHAQLTQSDKGWVVKDLRSENGTYVNGEKISERALADGDRVHFGTVRLVFRAG